MRRALILSLLAAVCLPAGIVWSQSDDEELGPPPVGDPYGRSETWLQPTPVLQLEQDAQLRSTASGGIFVPAMSDGELEPEYQVIQDDEVLHTASTGSAVWVVPGEYTVLVGSGVPENMLEFEVVVVEGLVTFVPVEWSGLMVSVVNERGTPFRGSYELVRLPSREYVGLGLGASLSEGDKLDTWLLWPGTYMILAAGESYQARKNFVTLRLLPGELLRYTVVMDSETGDLLGAGEIQLAPENTEGWKLGLVMGGSVSFNSANNVVGKAEGTELELTGFIEAIGGLDTDEHLVYARLNTELGGGIRLPDRPFVSDVDELNLDLLYAYRLTSWFGPYVRSSLESNLLPAYQLFDEERVVRRYDVDNRLLETIASPVLEVDLAQPFSPITLEAGAGGLLDFSAGYWLNVDLRLGVGARQLFARELYIAEGTDADGYWVLRQVDDVGQVGAEGALILELSPIRWLQLKVDASTLLPFDDAAHPLLDLRASATLRLTSIASLNYTIRVQEDPRILSETQVDQAVLLRFAYKLL
ncbi:MAG: hypothetical protein RBU37_23075 [Myxococcota bacterium]|jgi:hypothetical protein|nr:hypothetical protein [Myxococcota bacterium]